jgi:hypothetical protein
VIYGYVSYIFFPINSGDRVPLTLLNEGPKVHANYRDTAGILGERRRGKKNRVGERTGGNLQVVTTIQNKVPSE